MVASNGFISNIKIGDSVLSTLLDNPIEVISTNYGIEVACPREVPTHLLQRVYPRKRPSLILDPKEIVTPGENPVVELREAHPPEGPQEIPLVPWTWHPVHGNLHVVLDYLECGVNVMPLKLDGLKRPKGDWGKYHHTWTSKGAIETYFVPGSEHCPSGIGIALGPISGNLQMVECDMQGEKYADLIDEIDRRSPGLSDKLTLRVESGSGGMHLFFRSIDCPASAPLARRQVGIKENGSPDVKVLIEFRGIGSQAVAAGSPPITHKSNKPYRVIFGDWHDIPFLTKEERDIVLDAARHFNEYKKPTPPERKDSEGKEYDPGDLDLPGTDFNARGDWKFMEDAGYVIDKEDGKSTHWTRPDKVSGTSVTTDYMGAPILHCFSSSIAEFDADGNYTRFSAYAKLVHADDFSEAAKDLVELGYGKAGREQAAKRKQNDRLWEVFQKKRQEQDQGDDEPVVAQDDQEQPKSDKDNPLFAYLWKNNHKYITDQDRAQRMKSIAKVSELMPSTGFFTAYLQHHLPTSDCSVVFHLASALVMAGHLLNRRVSMEVGGSTFYPNLWVGLIAGSSTHRKSTAINCAKRHLQASDLYSQTILSDSFTMESLISQLGFVLPAEKDADGDKKDDGKEQFNVDGLPSWMGKRRFCEEESRRDPTTFLKGAGIFHLNEIGGWLSTLTRSHNVSAKETITEWYDSPPEFRRETRSQGTYYIWKPCVSILGASTTQWLTANCGEADMMAGFLPRWLFFTSKEVDYVLPIRDNPPENSEAPLEKWIDTLQNHQRRGMNLSVDAFHHYWKWRTDLGQQEHAGIIGSWVNRMADYAFKVAMIYEASTQVKLEEIGVESMRLATSLVDYLLVDLAGLLEELSFNKNEAQINKVYNAIRDTGTVGITRTDLFKTTKMHKQELEICLSTLAERETVVEREVKTGGRPGKRYFAV